MQQRAAKTNTRLSSTSKAGLWSGDASSNSVYEARAPTIFLPVC